MTTAGASMGTCHSPPAWRYACICITRAQMSVCGRHEPIVPHPRLVEPAAYVLFKFLNRVLHRPQVVEPQTKRQLHEYLWNARLPWFFFQAEDGIRDSSVTGVQTCALPI